MLSLEIEHTTAIYSGLLRMADLLTLQPRDQHFTPHCRPGRAHASKCDVRLFALFSQSWKVGRCQRAARDLSYDAVHEISRPAQSSTHMRESIVEEYEEFFDAG